MTLRIEICGGIGVGKSTLAARLAAHIPRAVFTSENFQANPLWKLFYRQPENFLREKNISFLAQHFAEIKTASNASLQVCDFSPIQDLAYAAISNNVEHLSVMQKIFDHLSKGVSAPTAIIHLSTSVDKQMMQIHARGRKEELNLDMGTLKLLNQKLEDVLGAVEAHQRVLTIDVNSIDVRTDKLIVKIVKDFCNF